jgi:hypothetical protein
MSVNSKVSTAKILSTTTTSTKVTSVTDSLAQRYLALKEQEEALKAEREALNEEVRAHVVDNKLVTSHGTFTIQTRRTMSWSLSALKSILGREWVSFVSPDTKLVKARMETKDEVGCLLECEAIVTTSEAVTFSKS